MTALVLVDLQYDFFPEGALGIKDADSILPRINTALQFPFNLIVATKDWHPSSHGCFAANQNKPIGGHITLGGIDQILWPTHCVEGTKGAELVLGWDHSVIDEIIYKGTDPLIDSYSAFFDNCKLKSTGLEEFLNSHHIEKLFFAGLATDYCVKFSVLDAINLGFECYILVDACKGVNLNPDDSEKALKEMEKAGAFLMTTQDLVSAMFSQNG